MTIFDQLFKLLKNFYKKKKHEKKKSRFFFLLKNLTQKHFFTFLKINVDQRKKKL